MTNLRKHTGAPLAHLIALLLLAALTVAFAQLASAASTPDGPLATVKRASDQIVLILSDKKLPRNERWTHIAPIISENFDFHTMSQSILAQRWRSASPAQQQQFVEFFSQYIEATYRSKIEAYSGQRIEYTDEKVRGDRAAVNSVIHTGNTEIPVGYFLRRGSNGKWKAYDVTIEGVSLVSNYRDTYAVIAKSSGISGILADVRRRAGAASVSSDNALTRSSENSTAIAATTMQRVVVRLMQAQPCSPSRFRIMK